VQHVTEQTLVEAVTTCEDDRGSMESPAKKQLQKASDKNHLIQIENLSTSWSAVDWASVFLLLVSAVVVAVR